MIPIYEQGDGKGIGHGLQSFLISFDKICQAKTRKAKLFAFIFYDFNDHEFKARLKSLNVFANLDRLSRNRLTIFYLHSGGRRAIAKFNSTFLKRLEIKQAPMPCVVFFRFEADGIIR